MKTVSTGALRYLRRRLAFAALLVFVVSSSALLLVGLAPGDFLSTQEFGGLSPEVVARERARLGLDRPLPVQYADWLWRAARFDLGQSLKYGRPVRDLVGERAGYTALLGAAALLLATSLGLPLGVFTGSRAGPATACVRAASVVCLSIPPLITSLVFAVVAARTGWFPVGGLPSPAPDAGLATVLGGWLWHLALPALALALPFAATLERLQAVSMAEALGEPHILAAAGRGVPRGRLIWHHGLRGALRPVIGIYGIIVGSLFSGSFAVEIVTSWPGLGSLMWDALVSRDLHLVAGCGAVGALFLAAGTLAADVALAVLDPRVGETS